MLYEEEQMYNNHCVIRLSLGKLLVNLVQVVKRTNTPLLRGTIVNRTTVQTKTNIFPYFD